MPPLTGRHSGLLSLTTTRFVPRTRLRAVGLPNPDGSFTCTMFAPFELFDQLDTGGDPAVTSFFNKNFPDAVPLLPDLCGQYKCAGVEFL